MHIPAFFVTLQLKLSSIISMQRKIYLVLFTLAVTFNMYAGRFALDSIAEWGSFPRFIVNTYRWGDKFFNSYDTAYVNSSGYKFNVKVMQDSWLNYYHFDLPNDVPIRMNSDPSTSIGAHLTYLAVSVGYDINVSEIFQGVKNARSRYQFGFNCSLLGIETWWESNQTGTKLRRFGDIKNANFDFNGVDVNTWGLDVYYFFNNKRYSQAAAFSYGRIQKRSQGSLYAGVSIYSQNYDFDFGLLPYDMLSQLPEYWDDHHYRVKTRNYAFRFGYGYNWVFARHWLLGATISPTIGAQRGYVNSEKEKTSFALRNHAGLSVVWNNNQWFAGAIGKVDSSIVSDRETMFMGNDLSFTFSVGYRFNLW